MKSLLFAFTLLLLGGCASLNPSGLNTNDQKVVLDGYDVVAYFSQNAALPGSSQFQAQYEGATWWFSSEANRQAFLARPALYQPQYGGYCAYAMSKDFLVPVDPQAFTLYRGRLYLNYSKSVRETWLKHKDEYIVSADKYWAKRLAQLKHSQ